MRPGETSIPSSGRSAPLPIWKSTPRRVRCLPTLRGEHPKSTTKSNFRKALWGRVGCSVSPKTVPDRAVAHLRGEQGLVDMVCIYIYIYYLFIYLFIYICSLCIIYIYIYIWRERERYPHMLYVYTYIYIYICILLYVFMYFVLIHYLLVAVLWGAGGRGQTGSPSSPRARSHKDALRANASCPGTSRAGVRALLSSLLVPSLSSSLIVISLIHVNIRKGGEETGDRLACSAAESAGSPGPRVRVSAF